MMKCPRCGYEQEKQPYKYNGELRAQLPLILAAFKHNTDLDTIVDMVEHARRGTGSYVFAPDGIRNAIRRIGLLYGFYKKEIVTPSEIYDAAMREHIFLLRAEGMTFRAIGLRVDRSQERVRQIIWKFGKRVTKKRTRFYFTELRT